MRITCGSLLLCGICSTLAVLRLSAGIDASLTAAQRGQLRQEARLVVDLLQNYHYSGRSFREISNPDLVGRFLDEIDPQHLLLTASDLTFIHSRFDHSFKSVYLLRGDLQPAFEIFDLLAQREHERHAWIEQRLVRGFEFNTGEVFSAPRAWPAAESDALDRRWDQWLREQVLRQIVLGRAPADAVAFVADAEREHDRQFALIDALAVREKFFDALIRSFDPHSGYFSVESAHEFAVSMENAVAGAGFDLRKEDNECVVAEVWPGGPADLLSDLQPGDIVTALADGDGEFADAGQPPLATLLARTRGEAGSKLRVRFHARGETAEHELALERKRFLFVATRAQGGIAQVPDAAGAKHRIGWILLPQFYEGGTGDTASSLTHDVREIIAQMLARGIEGLVLDLRGNPGGALKEAIALSSLFLDEGNVVFSRGLDGEPVSSVIDPKALLYRGPLVLLTSAQSASASEVFSGAMKFHHRAFVVGDPATFGKGTVQTYVELARARPDLAPAETAIWGTLRLTSQRFYLPDGHAVQRDGVAADIPFPADPSDDEKREADLPGALPAETIKPPASVDSNPAVHVPSRVDAALLARLRDVAAGDIGQLPEWKLWREAAARHATLDHRESFSANLEQRRAEWAEEQARRAALLAEWRELVRAQAFPSEVVFADVVQATLAAHQQRLLDFRDEAGQPVLERLHHGYFTVKTGDRLRRLYLAEMDFTAFEADAPALAQAFNEAAGTKLANDGARAILRDLTLLKYLTDDAVLGCFARQISATDSAAVRRGVDAVLLRITEIDPDRFRGFDRFDVPLREALRLAAGFSPGSGPTRP